MSNLSTITAVEAKLFVREPGTWLLVVLLPTIVLIAVGLIFGPPEPAPELGGARYIALFVPSMVVMSLAILGVNTLPTRLVKYREKGVLRRLSTTPVQPAALLAAQLMVNMAAAIAGLVTLLVVGHLVFGVPLPQDPIGFAVAFLLGMASLFALGLLVAAVAPTPAIATGLAVPLFAAVMTLGGVYVPRWLLPEPLVELGNYVPPGVQSMLDAWQGSSPDPVPLVIMAAITVVAGIVAARRFTWE